MSFMFLLTNTKYIHCKHRSMKGVSSATNSEYAYLMMAERPKYVAENYRKFHLNRNCADVNTTEYNWSFYTVNKL
jgi:hypothetical protein